MGTFISVTGFMVVGTWGRRKCDWFYGSRDMGTFVSVTGFMVVGTWGGCKCDWFYGSRFYGSRQYGSRDMGTFVSVTGSIKKSSPKVINSTPNNHRTVKGTQQASVMLLCTDGSDLVKTFRI
jgi:hypothetical protein